MTARMRWTLLGGVLLALAGWVAGQWLRDDFDYAAAFEVPDPEK